MIHNLYAGTYSVTVKDTNNCIVNSSVVLVEPEAITFILLLFMMRLV